LVEGYDRSEERVAPQWPKGADDSSVGFTVFVAVLLFTVLVFYSWPWLFKLRDDKRHELRLEEVRRENEVKRLEAEGDYEAERVRRHGKQ
jgi:hypothetical protein